MASLGVDSSCHCTYRGTFRCLALEYFMHGIVDEKTDVFAFGVFLLELISGRKPVDGSHKSLLSWAKPYLNDGTIHMLVDPRLGEYYDVGQVKRLTFIASLCIRAAATWRPFMTEVGKVTSYNYMSLSIILVPVPEYPIFSHEDIERRDFILQANSSPYNEDGSLQTTKTTLRDVCQAAHTIMVWLRDCAKVLDEADRLLSMEFKKVIDDILKALSQDRRTYLFSATMAKKITKLQSACLNKTSDLLQQRLHGCCRWWMD